MSVFQTKLSLNATKNNRKLSVPIVQQLKIQFFKTG